MKRLFWILTIGFLSCGSIAWSKTGNYAGRNYLGMIANVRDTSVILQINDKFVRIDFINPWVFRIRMNNQNSFPEGGMVKYGIVNTKCQGQKVTSAVKGNSIEYTTEQAKLSIDKKDGRITLSDLSGNIVTQNDQSPSSDPENGFGLSFKLGPKERLYGLGDLARDRIQRRGSKEQVIVMDVASYVPIPFLMSDQNWAVFLNTTVYHNYDAGVTVSNRLSFKSGKGVLDYFLIAGKSLPDLLDKYTDITGKPTLLPKWGYGLTFIPDERGMRARDVLYESYEFRRQSIPCDVIGFEPGWMEKYYDFSTDKQWNKERFDIPSWLKDKNYGKFSDALRNMNFKFSLWLCIDYDLSEYEEMQLHGAKKDKKILIENKSLEGDLIHDPHFMPVYFDKDHKAGVPWFEHLKKFVDDGASAFKMDAANQVCFHLDRKWRNGMEDYEMHNLYPLLVSKQMNIGFKEYTGRRSMIYNATGYAGIQRYSATWAGDVGGGRKTMTSLINDGLSGISNATTDMEVTTDVGIHFGFFQALSKVLGWQMYVEPWFLGEKLAAMFKEYCNLRYSLIPYIYSMAHIATDKALPIIRAMPMMYPEDRNCDKYLHQYMFGDAFLVSAFDSVVYLPEGEWIDYWTKKRWQGSQEIHAEYPKDKGGPLFVKAGAIIPTQAVKGYIGTDTPENIIWEIFPKGKSKFTLYEDDGESYNYLKGELAKTVVDCSETSEGISITVHPRVGIYKNMPTIRTHSFKIFYPHEMVLSTEGTIWNYDSKSNLLTVESLPETDKNLTLSIRFNK